jgi:hypothetical protein
MRMSRRKKARLQRQKAEAKAQDPITEAGDGTEAASTL